MCNKDEFVLEPEGIHLEYKSALKGIPKSVWDTYSSFANADGGKIVLGVGEMDEGYVLEGVPNIESRLKDIHNILNNKIRVSASLGARGCWSVRAEPVEDGEF